MRSLGSSPSLTEHPFQPDEAADEAVKVDVHVFVRIAHGDDVIELAVEMEACIIDCISHLIAIDGTGMVCVIVLEDFLKIQSSKTAITHLIPN